MADSCQYANGAALMQILNMRENIEGKKLIGVSEAEQVTSVSRWTWRRCAYTGRVASVKMGSRLLIPRSEIDRIIEKNLRPAVDR